MTASPRHSGPGPRISSPSLWAIWRRADRFVVTTHRVVVIRGIVSRYERAVPLTHIQDVTLRTRLCTPAL